MNRTENEPTPEQVKEHARRQKEAADRTLRLQNEKNTAMHINTKLTDEGHKGKHPSEPHKDPHASAAKTGKKDIKVKTRDEHTDGETTDEVVVDPAVGAENLGAPLDEAQRTAAAARGDEPRSAKKKSAGSKRK